MDFPEPIPELVERLAARLRAAKTMLVTVESCTGGLLGAAITDLEGVSDGYLGGYITYAKELKNHCVGVRKSTIKRWGAVSPQTAMEMARGGREHAKADIAISITGIAGPGTGDEDKPVGTVWIAVHGTEIEDDCRRFLFPGDRSEVRRHSVIASLSMTIQAFEGRRETLGHERERWDA